MNCRTVDASVSFSPFGRRWREAPDEGAFSPLVALTRRFEGVNELSANVRGKVIPLLVRRGGCGIKKISAKPTLMPQTGWSLTSICFQNAFLTLTR
jgi:hypothetical protein